MGGCELIDPRRRISNAFVTYLIYREICSESKLTIKVSSDRSLSIMGTKTVTLSIPVNVILQDSADGGGGGECDLWQFLVSAFD